MFLCFFLVWKVFILLVLGFFVCFYVYNFVWDVLQFYVQESQNKFFKLFVFVVNIILLCVVYVLLLFVYLFGVLVVVLQLWCGIKYQCFFDWLDYWLQYCKQIGLFSFFCVVLYVFYSFCLLLCCVYCYDLVNLVVKQVLVNKSYFWVEEEVWWMEIYFFLGVLVFGMLFLLVVILLLFIVNLFNWREFSFVQFLLGFVVFVLSILYMFIYGWICVFEESCYKFYLFFIFMFMLLVFCVVILVKVLFFLFCISCRFVRIWRGWERESIIKFMLFIDYVLVEKMSYV